MDTQTYANHRHRPRLWSTGALAALIAFVLIAWMTITAATRLNVALLLITYATVIAIIRLEMQTRLARLGRAADLAGLSMRQVVALRFASDAELPSLLQRATAEHLTADQIKRAITSWQADDMRT